jgi:chemotaxis protein CheC
MLSTQVISELEIVARRGAENASEALSIFLRERTQVSVRTVSVEPLEEIPEQFGGGDNLVVGLLSRVVGDVEGNSMLLFGRDDALKLVAILGGKRKNGNGNVEGFGELERSMLEETANVTITSFMNSLTSHLGERCIPNAPVYLLDLAGAIVSVALMEIAEAADRALVISTTFSCKEENLSAIFIFLPSPESLAALEEGLTGA